MFVNKLHLPCEFCLSYCSSVDCVRFIMIEYLCKEAMEALEKSSPVISIDQIGNMQIPMGVGTGVSVMVAADVSGGGVYSAEEVSSAYRYCLCFKLCLHLIFHMALNMWIPLTISQHIYFSIYLLCALFTAHFFL